MRDENPSLWYAYLQSSIQITLDDRPKTVERYTKWTIGQMHRRFPNFDWPLFFDTMFAGVNDSSSNDRQVRLNASDEVIIYAVEFIAAFDKLLATVEPR